MFSKSCEYGIQATIYIALHATRNKNISIKEIAQEQEIPAQYLSKIMQLLVKKNIVESTKGPNGGFSLKKNPNKLTLYEIIEIIDGTDIFDRCGMGLKKCLDKEPCPIHNEYKLVKAKIKKILKEKSLQQLVEDINDGKSILNYRHN